MNNTESKNVSRIPLLSSIPIIGEFFKNTSTSKDRHELIILITPTIVSSDDVQASDRLLQEYHDVQNEYNSMKKLNPNKGESAR